MRIISWFFVLSRCCNATFEPSLKANTSLDSERRIKGLGLAKIKSNNGDSMLKEVFDTYFDRL